MLNESCVSVESAADIGAMATMGVMSEPERYIVESRYGNLTFEPSQIMTMARGILGFPQLTQYGLTKLESQQNSNLVLLQSLEDAAIGFPTIALDLKNTLIAEQDLLEVYEANGIKPEDGAILCILTIRQEAGNTVVTANLRAPIFIDTSRKMAWQVVLGNQSYPIRHQI